MSALRLSPRRHATRGRGHPVLRWVAYSLAIITGVSAFGTYAYFTSTLGRIDTADVVPLLGENRPPPPPAPTDESKGEWINILLMGSDTREGANAGIGGANGGMRNDTTIVMHISADRTRVEFMSIPRDSWVRIPDCTLFDGSVVRGWTTKFNVAFANGAVNNDPAEAAACVQRAVEQLTGIYIHYYAVIDFAGFVNMVDALGGVPMCVPGHIVAPEAALDVQAGPQIFNGQTAIAWARARKATVGKEWVDGSDLGRIERQHELLARTIEVIQSKNLLFDSTSLRNFIAEGADSLTTSPRLADLDFILGLAFSLRHIDPANIVFTTVPNEYTPDFLNVTWTRDANAMFDDIINDRPISGRSVADASTSGVIEPSLAPSAEPGAIPDNPEGAIDPLANCPAG